MPDRLLTSALFKELAEPFTAEPLFDQMPDTVFFIKDAAGRYLCVNQTLVSRCRRNSKSQLLGQTPSSIFGDTLGRQYEAQDQEIIRSGRQLLDKLELHVYRPGELGWCLTSKLPLFAESRKVIGLVGISRDLKMPDVTSSDFKQIANAISLAQDRLAAPPTVSDLARTASMSIYQLDRRMKKLFGLTTGQWLLKTRIEQASRQLLESSKSITNIALGCGYRDHSAFARQFKRTTGRTPSDFRKWGRP